MRMIGKRPSDKNPTIRAMTDPRTIMGPMAASLESATGRSVEDWVSTAQELGLDRHSEIRETFRNDYGLSYGHAYMLASITLGYGQQGEAELVDGLFSGPRGNLRPARRPDLRS